MSDLHPPPLAVPIVDGQTRMLTRPWMLWYQNQFTRIGGLLALTNLELAAQLEELAAGGLFGESPAPAPGLDIAALFTETPRREPDDAWLVALATDAAWQSAVATLTQQVHDLAILDAFT